VRDLRWLTACGSLLVAAGCAVGWYELSAAALVDGPVQVVRPNRILGLGALAWLVVAPLVAVWLVPSTRRAVAVAVAVALPGAVLILLAAGLPRRTAVSGETIGELVAERPVGQALSLVGALIVGMALVTAWTRAPDWTIPPRWADETVTEP
jgi:hypothetical protein